MIKTQVEYDKAKLQMETIMDLHQAKLNEQIRVMKRLEKLRGRKESAKTGKEEGLVIEHKEHLARVKNAKQDITDSFNRLNANIKAYEEAHGLSEIVKVDPIVTAEDYAATVTQFNIVVKNYDRQLTKLRDLKDEFINFDYKGALGYIESIQARRDHIVETQTEYSGLLRALGLQMKAYREAHGE